MNERMKTFIYCAITAVVTTIVVSVGQPRAAQAQIGGTDQTITHIIKFGSSDPSAGKPFGISTDDLRTLIIKKQ